MEQLQHLNDLLCLIETRLEEYLEDKKSFQLVKSKNLDNMPHLFFYSKSKQTLKIYLSLLCSNYYNTNITLNNMFSQSHEPMKGNPILFKANNYLTILDMSQTKFYDRNSFSSFMVSLVNHKSLNHPKRFIVVCENINGLSYNLQLSFKHVLEKYSDTTWFILCDYLKPFLSPLFQGFVTSFRLNLKMEVLLMDFIEKCYPELLKHNICNNSIELLKLCDGDPVNLCILLNLDPYMNYRGHLFGLIQFYFDHIYFTMKNEKQRESFSALRELCIKLSASCIPVHIVAKAILRYTELYFPQCCTTIVEFLSDMETTILYSQKPLLAYEEYIEKIIHVHSKSCDNIQAFS